MSPEISGGVPFLSDEDYALSSESDILCEAGHYKEYQARHRNNSGSEGIFCF